MKKLIIIAGLYSAVTFGCNNSTTTSIESNSLDTAKLQSGDVYYQCQMHPEVLSAKPGKCGKCGEMELMAVTKK